MMKSIYIPKMPNLPSYDELSVGITTRVFAKKLQERRYSQLSDSVSRRSTGSWGQQRRMSFLEGTTIPNSNLKKMSKEEDKRNPNFSNDYFSKIKERDEFVDELLSKLKCEEEKRKEIKDIESTFDREEEWDRIMYDKIQRELARINRVEERENSTKKSDNSSGSLQTEDEKRINRRTAGVELVPEGNNRRRSTVDSIKSAIEQSASIQKLINIDKLENDVLTTNSAKESDSFEVSIEGTTPENLATTGKIIATKNQHKNIAKSAKSTSSSKENILKSGTRSPSVITLERLSHLLTSDKTLPRRKSILKQNALNNFSNGQKKRVSIQPGHTYPVVIQKKTSDHAQKSPLAMHLRPEGVHRNTRKAIA